MCGVQNCIFYVINDANPTLDKLYVSHKTPYAFKTQKLIGSNKTSCLAYLEILTDV